MRDDLKDRFALADDVRAPDLWSEARRRAATPGALLEPSLDADRGPARHRLLTVGVAFAVFAAAALFAWDLSHGGGTPERTPLLDLGSELPEGWSELPPPPEVRSGAATAWTGSELLVWGGYEFVGSGNTSTSDDGFAFDAGSRVWRRMPSGPLSWRSDMAYGWTGDELLIWGGWTGESGLPTGEGFLADGAAYDPLDRTWRRLPRAPLRARAPFSVWTGEGLIVWGSRDRSVRYRDGAVYTPATDSWRTIADAPLDITDGSAVWTGEEMIVFGAALDGNNRADTRTAVGQAYNPGTDAWRELPASGLSPQAHIAEWLAGEMIAWDYEHRTAAYDPRLSRWRALPPVPLRFFECSPRSEATPEIVFGEFCGQTVVFSTEEDAWHRAPIPVPEVEGGCCWVHEPVAAGDVILVPSLLYDEPPARTSASDRRMFAFNPPPVVRTDPRGEVLEPDAFVPRGAEREGDRIRLPVVFPDGSRATLAYPIPLDLASLGIQPDVSYVWRDDPAPRYPIVFLHDPDASIAAYVEGARPLYRIDGGGEIWSMSGGWESRRMLLQGAWVRLRLDSWTVLMAAKTVADAFAVADLVHIRETTAGFPVVEAVGPIGLAEGFGEAEGAQLAFGDAAAEPDTVSQLDAAIFLSPDGCNGGTEVSGTYGSACLGDGNVFASIYGDRAFVRNVVAGLSVEAFRPGPPGVT